MNVIDVLMIFIATLITFSGRSASEMAARARYIGPYFQSFRESTNNQCTANAFVKMTSTKILHFSQDFGLNVFEFLGHRDFTGSYIFKDNK